MTNREMPDFNLNQLFEYMESSRPTLRNDPISLAQSYQQTIDGEHDPNFRQIMGTAGEEVLNKLVPKQLSLRLSLVTNRLIVLTMEKDGLQVNEFDTSTFITGHLDEFVFENANDHVERDMLLMKLIQPEFMVSRPDAEKSGKPIVSVSKSSKYTIPVDAVSGRFYDPEALARLRN
jgi:hypothetical protein